MKMTNNELLEKVKERIKGYELNYNCVMNADIAEHSVVEYENMMKHSSGKEFANFLVNQGVFQFSKRTGPCGEKILTSRIIAINEDMLNRLIEELKSE